MKILKNISAFMILFSLMMLVSCEYEFIEIAAPTPPDPNDTTIDTVSFSAEIEPIFAASSCTNCHSNSGATAGLNLSAGSAYNSITSNGLVVADDPDASKIYYYPNPVTGTHNTKYGSNDDADLIYLWIYQGALDN